MLTYVTADIDRPSYFNQVIEPTTSLPSGRHPIRGLRTRKPPPRQVARCC